MTPNHARSLAVEIDASFQNNAVAVEVWVAELADLEYQAAFTAIRRLREGQDRAPSVRAFREAYAAVARTNAPDPVAELRDVKAVSRDDHVAELRRRAPYDPAAEAELARWERLAARRRHPSHVDDEPAVIGPPT